MPLRTAVSTLVFDAYGTLFDTQSVSAAAEALFPGKGTALARTWRATQLQYTWLRSLMDRYEDFSAVTDAALRYALAAHGLQADEGAVRRLTEAYLSLDLFPDVRPGLAHLGGARLAILSNGSPGMLNPLVRHAGLADRFTILSVDEVGTYKPSPRVYQLAVDRLGADRRAIGFVSSNGWDACGAAAFGFRTVWVNRTEAPADRLGAAPDAIIASLEALPGCLGALE